MIDLQTEKTMSLAEAIRLLPPGRTGKPIRLGTLLRWISEGSRGPGGELVKLEAVRLGGRWLTSREALQRFVERLTPKADPDAGQEREVVGAAG
jgi:Protein of unknown function (DUF1580)